MDQFLVLPTSSLPNPGCSSQAALHNPFHTPRPVFNAERNSPPLLPCLSLLQTTQPSTAVLQSRHLPNREAFSAADRGLIRRSSTAPARQPAIRARRPQAARSGRCTARPRPRADAAATRGAGGWGGRAVASGQPAAGRGGGPQATPGAGKAPSLLFRFVSRLSGLGFFSPFPLGGHGCAGSCEALRETGLLGGRAGERLPGPSGGWPGCAGRAVRRSVRACRLGAAGRPADPLTRVSLSP